MATAIIQTSDQSFKTDNGRGTTLDLYRLTDGRWRVLADNASRRAWRSLGCRDFDDLSQVEKAYNAFRGVTKLIENKD